MRRAGGDVGGDVVVGVDEPVRGGGLVDREPGEGLARVGAEVVRDHVLGLNPVLDEEGVAHRLEGDVVDHAQEVHAVDDHRAVVGVVDRVAAHIRVAHGADHVEVDRVAPQPEALARVAHLVGIGVRALVRVMVRVWVRDRVTVRVRGRVRVTCPVE